MTKAQIIHATMRALSMPVTAEVGELRWTADPAYLVDAADTYLGRSIDRNYYKEQNGPAIAVFQESGPGGWAGPVLVSTEENAIRYYYGGVHLGTYATFTYGGLIWYVNAHHHYRTNNYDTGGLVPYIPRYDSRWAEDGPFVLEAAHVRIGKGGFALWP